MDEHEHGKENIEWEHAPFVDADLDEGAIAWFGRCRVCRKRVYELYRQEPGVYNAAEDFAAIPCPHCGGLGGTLRRLLKSIEGAKWECVQCGRAFRVRQDGKWESLFDAGKGVYDAPKAAAVPAALPHPTEPGHDGRRPARIRKEAP